MTPPVETQALRRPLGLVLPGGGALGAWQAAAMGELAAAGLVFDKVIGFSAGALAGAGYLLNRVDELVERWSDLDKSRILRFDPKLKPHFSLFSPDGMWDSVQNARDDERARREARCELTVVAYGTDTRRSEYFRFTPGGERGWDGPLAHRLIASCAIPGIFPPIEIAGRVFRDGVVPGEEPMHFDALSGCHDIVVLEMVRSEEAGRAFWNPWKNYEQSGRDAVLRHVDHGIQSLDRHPNKPRVFRLQPSRVLDYSMLSFTTRACRPAMDIGRSDAQAFLRNLPKDMVSKPS